MLLYLLTLIGLTIFSYSQIDLNLTLFSNPTYQYFQQHLINLGYFNRAYSALVFLLLIILLFCSYLLFLLKAKFTRKTIFSLVLLTAVVCLFSYPAFSHDMFNYMFDARIVTTYGVNPYQFKALDFPSDLWIRFMHWTHRTYPYGPLWLVLTLPFSYLGFGKFVLTLINFKLLFLGVYLGNTILIKKILQSDGRVTNEKLLGVAFFAFNPLIIIETLVSPHNESLMLFFLLLGIYFLKKKKTIFALISVFTSGAIKYITFILLPIFMASGLIKTIKPNSFYHMQLGILSIPLLYLVAQREPYPWYFVTFIGIGSLSNSYSIKSLLVATTLGALLRYVPYLYIGSYPDEVLFWQNILFITPLILCSIYLLLRFVLSAKVQPAR